MKHTLINGYELQAGEYDSNIWPENEQGALADCAEIARMGITKMLGCIKEVKSLLETEPANTEYKEWLELYRGILKQNEAELTAIESGVTYREFRAKFCPLSPQEPAAK